MKYIKSNQVGLDIGKLKQMKFRKSLLAIAISGAMGVGTPIAIAQNEEAAEITTEGVVLEEIIVHGYGGSLQKSIAKKRNSENIMEAITSDEFLELPAVSMADALARLPGLYATEDRGNASLISARGLGPRMTFATLNGRELATATPDRAVRFEQFPPELISAGQVVKTPSANMLEGGVAATINLETINPLDLDERRVSLSADYVYYEQGADRPGDDGKGFRGSAAYTDQFLDDTLGISLGVSVQDQPATLLLTDRWGNTSSASDFNGDGEEDFLPWGGQTLSLGGSTERTSLLGKVQWKPNDRTVLTFDVYQAGFEIEEEEDNFWGCIYPWSGTPPSGIDPSSVSVDGSGFITAATGSVSAGEACLTVAPARWSQENELFATGLNAKWELGRWDIAADASYSLGERGTVWRSAFLNYGGPQTSIDVEFDGGPISIDYGAETDDLANYFVNPLTVANDGDLEDGLYSVQLDFGRELDGALSRLDFGVRYSDRDKIYLESNYSQDLVVSQDEAISYLESSANRYSIQGNSLFNFDVDDLVDTLYGGLNRSGRPIDKDQSWRVTEKTQSAYAMLSFDTEFAGRALTGNFGARLVNTETVSTGHTLDPVNATNPDGFIPNRGGTDYTELLPSFNATLSLTEDTLLRLGVARVMSRPPLDELRSSTSIDRTSAIASASGGNPELMPFVANQIDVSYEWYINDQSLLTFAGFFKDVESNISVETSGIAGNAGLGRPNGVGTIPVNGDGGQIRGLEIAYQTAFNFIPGLGFNGNIAFLDSNIEDLSTFRQPLIGLSELVYSAEIWYAQERFEAFLAYGYQDDYTSAWATFLPNNLQRFAPQETLDLKLRYALTDNLMIQLQGSNLTGEGTVAYSNDNPDDLVRTRDWGRRFSLGMSYQF